MHEDNYFVDAIHLLGKKKFCYGKSIPKLNIEEHYQKLDSKSQQFEDIKRFNWFSQGYLGYDKNNDLIIDVRYSLIPNEVDGLWGIQLKRDPNYIGHVKWVNKRDQFKTKWTKFSKMLFEGNC